MRTITELRGLASTLASMAGGDTALYVTPAEYDALLNDTMSGQPGTGANAQPLTLSVGAAPSLARVEVRMRARTATAVEGLVGQWTDEARITADAKYRDIYTKCAAQLQAMLNAAGGTP